jgi:ABC-type glutathione transport system ATPase component
VTVGRGLVVLRGTGAPALPAQEPQRADGGRGEELVRLEHARRRFTTRAEAVDAVAGVTLALKAGAFHALVVPSGCGKTTLLHLIAGLDRATRGRVTLAGEDVADRSREELAALRGRRHVRRLLHPRRQRHRARVRGHRHARRPRRPRRGRRGRRRGPSGDRLKLQRS